MRLFQFTLILILFLGFAQAQISDYRLDITPMSIEELPGMQSYSYGQYDREWLIVGGRIDGLHKRRPFEAFTPDGNNSKMYVVNIEKEEVWSSDLSTLSVPLQEQLASTNHNFCQHNDQLIITGGYGYSPTAGDHVTYNQLTSIDIEKTIAAIKNKGSLSNSITQISDSLFDVTGGRLEVIDDTFYLVGGHQFEGRYNPMGPDHGPGFFQKYTNQIRKFTLENNPLTLKHVASFTDLELHRRDFNVVPQIMPDQTMGLTAFSGVFQIDQDLPFLNSVDISSRGYTVNNNFTQYYNHYHCAAMPIYDSAQNEMHTVFFGGIARYFDDNGTLTQDDDVPFVKTIARVTRESDGSMSETKLDIEMPNLLGAGSEFIVSPTIPRYSNNILKLNDLSGDSILVGYIFGGIESTAPNVFFSNSDNVSSASNSIFKVYLVNKKTNSSGRLVKQNAQLFQVYPNPSTELIKAQFHLLMPSLVSVTLRSIDGKYTIERNLGYLPAKSHVIETAFNDLTPGLYFITLKTNVGDITHKLIIK